MLNFRYHIVSITAIFLAIAIGIAVGVGFAPSLDAALAKQASVDREQVAQLRTQLDQQSRVNAYSEAWSKQVDSESTKNALVSQRVALVELPGAPTKVVDGLKSAIEQAGGTVSAYLRVQEAILSASPSTLGQFLTPAEAKALDIDKDGDPATQLGELLGAALGNPEVPTGVDENRLLKVVETTGLVKVTSVNADGPGSDLVLIVSSATTDSVDYVPDSHSAIVGGLAEKSKVVVAGPNSAGVAGSDLASVRARGPAGMRISTVDTADLTSGQKITILACRERIEGGTGDYGAASDTTGPFPP